jgi:hypothetical protein
MRLTGGARLAVSMATAGVALFAIGVAPALGRPERRPRVITDGRLRPGHFETIRVVGFPGKGAIGVSFFPTAICEDGCAARVFEEGDTDAKGAAKFRVRMPGTFTDLHDRHIYFRNGERIDVNVTWEGADGSFDVATAKPEPVIVRTHGSHHD